MESFWDTFLATPYYYVGVIFAGLAALSFLVFLRGFLGGIGQIFKMSGHDGHLEHAYVRQVWGVYLLVFLFVVWEILRTVASWVGLRTGDTSIGLWFAGLIVLVVVFRYIKKALFSGGGGGH